MRYYLLAGEASGDLHTAHLVTAIRALDPDAELRGWGGDLMAEAGVEVVKHYRELAFMGFVEVVQNLPTILGNLKRAKADILAYRPDVLVLIDYPGFNLRIAKWARRQGLRVAYYISPQIWAWNSGRARAIERDVDLMLCILPFEPAFYQKYGMQTTFVGHPLLDVIPPLPDEQPALHSPRRVLLLPGSRQQEIARMLPLMLAVDLPDTELVIAGAPGRTRELYETLIAASGRSDGVSLYMNRTYEWLPRVDAAVVTSGTATLETALFGVPQVVVYKGSPVSYWLARRLINVSYISLVNLILDRPLVSELIQGRATPTTITAELQQLLHPDRRTRLWQGYRELRQMLGGPGASSRAATAIVRLASGNK